MIERKIRLYMLETNRRQMILPDSQEGTYKMHVKNERQQLSEELEQQIQKQWDVYAQQNQELARDQQTYFFSSFDVNNDIDYVVPNAFRYVEVLGRNPKFDKYKVEVASQSLTALSSICLVQTSDKQLLFGKKKNMSNKISGFSGYLTARFIENGAVNLYAYIVDSICNELPIQPGEIETIERIGQTYSPDIVGRDGLLNNKVYNNQFVVKLSLTAAQVIKRFEPNLQFASIYNVRMEKEAIIQEIRMYEKQLSSHFLAMLINYFKLHNIELYYHEIYEAFKTGEMSTAEHLLNARVFLWGLIGSKQIEQYSVAPDMWRALFKAIRYPVHYFVVAEDDQTAVEQKVNMIVNSNRMVGCNIALPWKQWVKETYDANATLPVANTLIVENERIRSFNSDGIGIVKAIERKYSVAGKTILLIGAGGAAQTVPYWLNERGVKQLYVCDINRLKAQQLKQNNNSLNVVLTVVELAQVADILPQVDIVIQASPCGMKGSASESPIQLEALAALKKSAVIVEMIFNPIETPIVLHAKSLGYETIVGKYMLIEQAAASFYEAFGRALTAKEKLVMEEAVLTALTI